MSKHADGPWHADYYPDTQGYKIRSEGRVIAIVKNLDSSPAMEPQMNKALISAAPELLEALEKIKIRLEVYLDDERDMAESSMQLCLDYAQQAIAKALGEQC